MNYICVQPVAAGGTLVKTSGPIYLCSLSLHLQVYSIGRYDIHLDSIFFIAIYHLIFTINLYDYMYIYHIIYIVYIIGINSHIN